MSDCLRLKPVAQASAKRAARHAETARVKPKMLDWRTESPWPEADLGVINDAFRESEHDIGGQKAATFASAAGSLARRRASVLSKCLEAPRLELLRPRPKEMGDWAVQCHEGDWAAQCHEARRASALRPAGSLACRRSSVLGKCIEGPRLGSPSFVRARRRWATGPRGGRRATRQCSGRRLGAFASSAWSIARRNASA